MKHYLLPFAMLAVAAIPAIGVQHGSKITLEGTEYAIDTVMHTQVGPGTTHTQLRVKGAHNLNVFYITVDVSTPGVSIRALSGRDMLAGNGCTSDMARSHSHDGLHYFAGSNGDFYFTAGKATNGSSIVGTPVNAFVVDREVFRTSNSSYQFSVDVEGIARVCRLNFQKGTATAGDKTVAFKAINNDAPDNGVTLYTSKFWGSSNQGWAAGNCAEVTARLVEGDNFWAGCKYRLEVTSEPGSTGDMTVPEDGFVIFGRGDAKDFVAGLKPGDVVTMDNITLTPEGTPIVPTCVMSGNPKNVGGGLHLDTEGERGDASTRQPRCGIGVSEDGNKIVMMVVDGRSSTSAGCTTGTLGDLLIYAGCHEAVNLDGGGSATLFTDALGVRNDCSDGRERAVSNAIYAVLEAPEDSKVASLCFYDFAPKVSALGLYTPRIMAFNAAGLALDIDFKDFTLSCPPELGEITADGHTLCTATAGYYPLTASYGDVKVTIPVEVTPVDNVMAKSKNVIIDNRHPYTIGLYATVEGTDLDINPSALDWTSEDDHVATVSDLGVITAVANGTTTVNGNVGELAVAQQVTVENNDGIYRPLLDATKIDSWSLTASTLKDLTILPLEQGLDIKYTVSKARGTKLAIKPSQATYGIPEAIELDLNPGQATIKSVSLRMQAANATRPITTTLENIAKGETNHLQFRIADLFDATDLTIFPLTILELSFEIGDPVGTESHLELPRIVMNYDLEKGVTDITADGSDAPAITVEGNVARLAAGAEVITVSDIQGRVLATGSGDSITLPEGHGMVILTADGHSAKVVY